VWLQDHSKSYGWIFNKFFWKISALEKETTHWILWLIMIGIWECVLTFCNTPITLVLTSKSTTSECTAAADTAHTLARWQHFSAVTAAILKLWHHIGNLTPSIDVYLFTGRTILPNFIPIWSEMTGGSLRLFEDVAPTTRTRRKKSSDSRSIPDLNQQSNNWPCICDGVWFQLHDVSLVACPS